MNYILPGFCFLIATALAAQKSNPVQQINIDSAAIAKIKLEGYPDFLAADGDDAWVLNNNKVEKISVKSSTPLLSVNVPGACGAMIVGFGSLWVASCKDQSVYRINKENGTIENIIKCGVADLQGEISIAAGDSALWILSDANGVLTRISATTNRVEASIPVLPNSYCAAYGFNAVWVTNTKNNSVQRINPKTNKVTATINVGHYPRFLACGEKGIWTLNQKDGTVSHINPGTNKLTATIDAQVPGTGGDIAAGDEYVWVRSANKWLLQTIHPVTNKIITVYTPVAGSGAVRTSKNYIWITAHDINTIWILRRNKQ